ncbi:MAG: hypothetical protein QOK12_3094 [Mycobacterium sp.]|jgi:hypothetical protein|nr:hypothetical protein [Mycobacterium sp.]
MPGASIKNEKSYEDLRRQGDSKQKLISKLRNS